MEYKFERKELLSELDGQTIKSFNYNGKVDIRENKVYYRGDVIDILDNDKKVEDLYNDYIYQNNIKNDKSKKELENTLFEEAQRFENINRYIKEQEDDTDDLDDVEIDDEDLDDDFGDDFLEDSDDDDDSEEDDADFEEIPEPIDVDSDEEVSDIDKESSEPEISDDGSVELDITDLVKSQKNIEDKQNKLKDELDNKLNSLNDKISSMDKIFDKLDSISNRMEKYREKTPEEKLNLRTLDSFPFNQKLSDFFEDKKVEMEKSGKNEYVLTDDDIEAFNTKDIRDSFDTVFDD